MQSEIEVKKLDIVQAIEIFFEGPKEVRILNTAHNGTMSGVFDDPVKLVDAVLSDSIQRQERSIYWTAQRLAPCKSQNAIYPNATSTTKATDVIEYRWLICDVDPLRPKNCAATFLEQEAAFSVAFQVLNLFGRLGFPGVLVSSGSGFYVLVPLEMPNTAGAKELMRDVLRALDAHFGTAGKEGPLCLPTASIDESMFDANQIIKIPGTIARKGEHSGERPHRLARIEYAPKITRRMDREHLEALRYALVESLPAEKAVDFQPKVTHLEDAGDTEVETSFQEVKDFLKAFNIPYEAEKAGDGGKLRMLVMRCPNSYNHNSGSSGPTEAWTGVNEKGQKLFECKHPSCALYSHANGTTPFHKFRAFVDPQNTYRFGAPPSDGKVYEFGVSSIRKAVTETVAEQNPLFKKPKVLGKKGDYIFAPIFPMFGEKIDGWFPRSRVSLIAGPSGVGKTSFMFPALAAQAKGEAYLGHESFKLPYLALTLDRGEFDSEEILENLQLGPEVKSNIVAIDYCTEDAAVKTIKEAIEAREVTPAVVFVDGIDLMIGKQKEMTDVGAFLLALRRVAEHYHVAIIGALGSPKLKQGEEFQSDRDALYGSSIWARLSSTVIRMTKGKDGVRRVLVMHRHSADEPFEMVFKSGRLVVREGIAEYAELAPAELPAVTFAKGRTGYWTVQDYMDAAGHARATAFRHIKTAQEAGMVREKPGKSKGYATQYTLAGSL